MRSNACAASTNHSCGREIIEVDKGNKVWSRGACQWMRNCNKGAYGHVFANFRINTSAETFKMLTNGRHSLLCALVMLKAAFAVILFAVLFIFFLWLTTCKHLNRQAGRAAASRQHWKCLAFFAVLTERAWMWGWRKECAKLAASLTNEKN